jgi:HTH-type transcriptional regulator / antitoxin HipB
MLPQVVRVFLLNASYMMHTRERLAICIIYSAMILTEIGELIRTARKRTGRSQEQVARSLGMSRATVSAVENGTVSEIGVRKLMALCAALGLELSVAAVQGRPTLQELRQEQRVAGPRT